MKIFIKKKAGISIFLAALSILSAFKGHCSELDQANSRVLQELVKIGAKLAQLQHDLDQSQQETKKFSQILDKIQTEEFPTMMEDSDPQHTTLADIISYLAGVITHSPATKENNLADMLGVPKEDSFRSTLASIIGGSQGSLAERIGNPGYDKSLLGMTHPAASSVSEGLKTILEYLGSFPGDDLYTKVAGKTIHEKTGSLFYSIDGITDGSRTAYDKLTQQILAIKSGEEILSTAINEVKKILAPPPGRDRLLTPTSDLYGLLTDPTDGLIAKITRTPKVTLLGAIQEVGFLLNPKEASLSQGLQSILTILGPFIGGDVYTRVAGKGGLLYRLDGITTGDADTKLTVQINAIKNGEGTLSQAIDKVKMAIKQDPAQSDLYGLLKDPESGAIARMVGKKSDNVTLFQAVDLVITRRDDLSSKIERLLKGLEPGHDGRKVVAIPLGHYSSLQDVLHAIEQARTQQRPSYHMLYES